MIPDAPNIEQYDRMPPWDEDAELCCLASLLLGDAAVRAAIRATVVPGDYLSADCQVLHQTACRMIDEGVGLDAVTLRAELDRRGVLKETGGVAFIARVLHTVPSPDHGARYADIVRDRSVLRKLAEAGARMVRDAYEPNGRTADELAQRSLDAVSEILARGRVTDYWKFEEILHEAYADLEKPDAPLLTTGLPSLDAQVGGIGAGEQLLIGARPSVGKSTLLRQMAVRIARRGIPVGFVSLEEDRKKIARNVIAAESGIENTKIRRRDVDDYDRQKIAEGIARLSKLPIVGSHNKARRLSDICALVHLWKTRHGVRIVFLDYLQRVGGGRGESPYERTSDISLRLSDLWKETGVAAIVAAQLNRKVEGREDKRPNMADLRDSGQIEQDADGILFLHREDYYHLEDQNYTPTHEAELIIAKWRDSVRGKVVMLESDMRFQTFLDPLDENSRAVHVRPPQAIDDDPFV